jgi:hypothetical protein
MYPARPKAAAAMPPAAALAASTRERLGTARQVRVAVWCRNSPLEIVTPSTAARIRPHTPPVMIEA